ncbi:hypothetical protein WG907_11230 [Sphingobium sp. AN558]|uniref:DUF6894 family protein n=1 Tax=Sphingobium sp. AN558 TaxID=3133442 RepID=UPI0030BC86DE
MTRFYLHLHNRIGFVRDYEGTELPDLESATRLAIDSIRDVLSEEVRAGHMDLRGHIDIVDDVQTILAVISFSSAIELHLAKGNS